MKILAVVLLLILQGITSCQINVPQLEDGSASVEVANISQVNDWLCVYTGVDAEEIIQTKFDLVDIDPDEFTTEEILEIKESGKIVIAYISIGEAEEYRYYWDPNASYLLEENPGWKENWYVDFSSKEWQGLIINDYIPLIKERGFDGLYLDTIETYQLEDRYPNCSKENMITFIKNISLTHRSSNFYMIPQNGLEIANDIMDYIDGIGVEETYYRAHYIPFLNRHINGIRQNLFVTIENERMMDKLLKKGKMILTLDYAILRFQVDRCYWRAQRKGYVPYVSIAELDRIIIHPGHEPD